MKKFNVILASVSALAAVAFSTCSAYATTRGLIATVVDKRAEATYGAGSYGNSIRLEVEFEEMCIRDRFWYMLGICQSYGIVIYSFTGTQV